MDNKWTHVCMRHLKTQSWRKHKNIKVENVGAKKTNNSTFSGTSWRFGVWSVEGSTDTLQLFCHFRPKQKCHRAFPTCMILKIPPAFCLSAHFLSSEIISIERSAERLWPEDLAQQNTMCHDKHVIIVLFFYFFNRRNVLFTSFISCEVAIVLCQWNKGAGTSPGAQFSTHRVLIILHARMKAEQVAAAKEDNFCGRAHN